MLIARWSVLVLVVVPSLASADPRRQARRAMDSLTQARDDLRSSAPACGERLWQALRQSQNAIEGGGPRLVEAKQQVDNLLVNALTVCDGAVLRDLGAADAALAFALSGLEDNDDRWRHEATPDPYGGRRDPRDPFEGRRDDDRGRRPRGPDPRLCWNFDPANPDSMDPGCANTKDGQPPMNRMAYQGLLAAAGGAHGDLELLEVVKRTVAAQPITTTQMAILLDKVASDLIRLDVVKACAPHLVDPRNATGIPAKFRNSLVGADAATVLSGARGDQG